MLIVRPKFRKIMKLKEEINDLVKELDRVHLKDTHALAWLEPGVLPSFSTAQNGLQRYYTQKALKSLGNIALILHQNDIKISSVIEIGNFEKILRQCVTELHAENELDISNVEALEKSHSKLIASIQDALSEMQMEFTHYFPAWTLGMEFEHPFQLGPVTIMTREQWIDSVQFSDNAIKHYLSTPINNANWKVLLKDALESSVTKGEPKGLAGSIYNVIRSCPSVLKIKVTGYEKDLSRKVAEIVCKSALDAISLLFGANEYFHQQALCDERLQPRGSDTIIETNGYLWLPGTKLGPRVRRLSNEAVQNHLAENEDLLNAFGYILNSLLIPTSSKHPNLTKRWATALNWMAEGGRESNDAVALTKIASSLDVLSCGGKFKGILEMLVHLTKTSESTIVVKGRAPSTLSKVVKDVYDNGRSQILHGTHFDRLKSFEEWKNHASSLARIALIECAVRLVKFKGGDGDTEFRTIPE